MQLQGLVSHSQIPSVLGPPFGLLVRGDFQDGFLNAKEFLGSTCPSLTGGASQSRIQTLPGSWAFTSVLVTNDKSV